MGRHRVAVGSPAGKEGLQLKQRVLGAQVAVASLLRAGAGRGVVVR